MTLRAILPCVLLLVLAPSTPPAAAAPPAEVLGWPVMHSEGVEVLPKWRQLLVRLAREEPRLRACLAEEAACPGAAARRWRKLVLGLRGRPLDEAVAAVHAFATGFPYRTDPEVWGRSDHWATPLEFLARSGDCEDYAIFQYATLRLLGVPAGSMRLVVVQDTVRSLPHAVLEVEAEGRRLILDNLRARPVSPEQVAHYRPYYAADLAGVHFPLSTLADGRISGRLLAAPARR